VIALRRKAQSVDINPLALVFDMRRKAQSIDINPRKRIYIISSLSEAKTYRICRKANISSRA
jgi:hypothetical protein